MLLYDHIGIPTKDKKENEMYIESLKVYVTPYSENKYRIEWVRVEENSPMPSILKEIPHVGFKVDNLEEVLQGVNEENVIVPPCSPAEGLRVAFIIDNGAPVEFLEY